MNHAEMAAALGVTRSAVTKNVKAGMPMDSVESAKKWRDANLIKKDHRAPIMEGRASAQEPAEDYQVARTRREIAEANLAELKEAELDGKLIRADAVRAAWAKRVASVREALLQMPSRLAPVLAAESDMDAVALALDEEVRRVLTDLASDVKVESG